jgi:hypothetical protein
MRLDFNVLWVEDQPAHVDAQIERISQLMQQEGFHFKPTLCRSIDEVQRAISTDVFTDEVDLVLVDWDLGSNLHGEDAIEAIRDQVRYKDVLFYSALRAPDELRRAAFDKELEGIYCASREQLVEEVMGVFESLVKKVLDVDHTRGIVMGATSDIDHMVSECLSTIYAMSDESGKTELLVQAQEFIEEELKNLSELAAKMRAASHFDELHEAHSVFTANDRLRMLARSMKTQLLEPHKQYRGSVTDYLEQVVPKRNTLGHVARVERDGKYVLIDRRGNVFDLETTRGLRRLILGLRADFRELLAALKSAAGGSVAS